MKGLQHSYSFPKIVFEDLGRQVPTREPYSRYRGTRQVAYNNLVTTETWYPPDFSEQQGDLFRTVGKGEEHRIDLVALANYKTTDQVWWAILLANGIKDGFKQILSGVKLRLPAFVRIASRQVT